MKLGQQTLWCSLILASAMVTTTAHAGVVASRAALDALLGASAVTEDFNKLTIGGAGGQGVISGSLNSTTNVPTLGTGQVVAGVDFSIVGATNFGGDLFVPQNGYFGFANPALLSGSSQLQIDFTGGGTTAFGLDLLEYQGFSNRVSFTVYGLDDTTPLATEQFYSINSPVTPVFFGFTDASGIGRVVVTGFNSWSPIIDNVTFGQSGGTVDAPASLPLAALALAALAIKRRRRS